ncbi:hypothetical protein GAY29_14205 [Azospirillum brasilense]|uniref:hypothetical protein n=1 Tax=Azospirillum brasilense TaxID=192 RepID=UPI00190B4783|nr:hypothetical protein [Azospirillum brasilense]MBK3734243.1 hypothetical protein [Azospirillum brasilense]
MHLEAGQRDRRLSWAVWDLLLSNHTKEPGWCRRKTIDTIEGDDELTAYFRSVAVAGRDAWADEVDRTRRLQYQRRRHQERGLGRRIEGSAELCAAAITELLPTWRAWGRMLIDAGAAPQMEG